MEKFAIVEKKNPLVVHGLFYSAERAYKFLAEGYYMDKTLTVDDFMVINKQTGEQV